MGEGSRRRGGWRRRARINKIANSVSRGAHRASQRRTGGLSDAPPTTEMILFNRNARFRQG